MTSAAVMVTPGQLVRLRGLLDRAGYAHRITPAHRRLGAGAELIGQDRDVWLFGLTHARAAELIDDLTYQLADG